MILGWGECAPVHVQLETTICVAFLQDFPKSVFSSAYSKVVSMQMAKPTLPFARNSWVCYNSGCLKCVEANYD